MENKTIITEEDLTEGLLDLIRNGFKQAIDKYGVGVLRTHSVSFDVAADGEKIAFEIKFTKKN